MDEARGWVDRQRGADDDQHVRRTDCRGRALHRLLVEHFAVEHDIGAHHPALVIALDAFRVHADCGGISGFARVERPPSRSVPVQFDDCATAGGLVQIVDVLRDDGNFFPCIFERRKEAVRGVRKGLRKIEMLRIIAEEKLGIRLQKTDAERLFAAEMAAAQPVEHPARRTEIRNPALRADARPSEGDDALRIADHLREAFFIISCSGSFLLLFFLPLL